MMKVFPKELKPIDKDDLRNAVFTLEENLKYLYEQTDLKLNAILKKIEELKKE